MAARRSSGPVLGSARFNRQPYLYSSASASASANLQNRLSPSLSFSLDRSISMAGRVDKKPAAAQKRTCMCSPTNHPGSFRCSLHKSAASKPQTASCGRLNMRRSAMKNSLVRIGVEGDWVRRALAALIRPSSHQQRRRAEFRRRPSRFSGVAQS